MCTRFLRPISMSYLICVYTSTETLLSQGERVYLRSFLASIFYIDIYTNFGTSHAYWFFLANTYSRWVSAHSQHPSHSHPHHSVLRSPRSAQSPDSARKMRSRSPSIVVSHPVQKNLPASTKYELHLQCFGICGEIRVWMYELHFACFLLAFVVRLYMNVWARHLVCVHMASMMG